MSEERVLIVGLGNPGTQYQQTRHNAGFIALDYFAAKNGLEIRTEKMQGHFCSARLSGKKVLLLKPMTYMNRSGDCVISFTRYFDLDLDNLLVLHDDLDLDSGRIKMVSGGGAGGHNGIRSLVNQLGTSDFARLKIGIGHPRNQEETAAMPVERFVLSGFMAEEWDLFQRNLDLIAQGVSLFIEKGISSAMNSINSGKTSAL
ncbi:MAG: aminoacyl-tRNA hydrolase [Desulfobulbaceae bacterium]|nr:aminoacyl-tRNA hydrolase [Desulfobulbaceae bacterium]